MANESLYGNIRYISIVLLECSKLTVNCISPELKIVPFREAHHRHRIRVYSCVMLCYRLHESYVEYNYNKQFNNYNNNYGDDNDSDDEADNDYD